MSTICGWHEGAAAVTFAIVARCVLLQGAARAAEDYQPDVIGTG